MKLGSGRERQPKGSRMTMARMAGIGVWLLACLTAVGNRPPTCRKPRFARAGRRRLLAMSGAALASCMLQGCDRYEERITTALERLSEGRGPGKYLAGFDYLCFDRGAARTEFAELAAKKSIPIAQSLARCGEDRSCCKMGSEVGGVFGLIKGDVIRCVAWTNRNNAFLTEPHVPICAKPSELIVRRETFATAMHIPYRSWRSVPGQRYFRIMERRQTTSQGSDMKSVAEFVAEAQALAERDRSGRIDISELANTAFEVGGDIATYEAELRKQGFTGGLVDTPLEGKLLAMRKIGSWGLGFLGL